MHKRWYTVSVDGRTAAYCVSEDIANLLAYQIPGSVVVQPADGNLAFSKFVQRRFPWMSVKMVRSDLPGNRAHVGSAHGVDFYYTHLGHFATPEGQKYPILKVEVRDPKLQPKRLKRKR